MLAEISFGVVAIVAVIVFFGMMLIIPPKKREEDQNELDYLKKDPTPQDKIKWAITYSINKHRPGCHRFDSDIYCLDFDELLGIYYDLDLELCLLHDILFDNFGMDIPFNEGQALSETVLAIEQQSSMGEEVPQSQIETVCMDADAEVTSEADFSGGELETAETETAETETAEASPVEKEVESQLGISGEAEVQDSGSGDSGSDDSYEDSGSDDSGYDSGSDDSCDCGGDD